MANAKKTTPKKKTNKANILKQLQDPKLSKAKKNQLVEQLYKGIDIK